MTDFPAVTEDMQNEEIPIEVREDLDIVAGIINLFPVDNAPLMRLEGNLYRDIIWEDERPIPSYETLIQKTRALKAAAPMRNMKGDRNRRLKDCDWVVARSFETGEPIPEEWATYRQALRDMPENYPNVYFDENGRTAGCQWPEHPEGKQFSVFRGLRES